LLAAVAAALMLGACAIQPDSSPRDIPEDDRLPLEPIAPDGGATEGSSYRVFLVTDEDDDGEAALQHVLRDVDPPSPRAVLDELFKGPSAEEFEAGFRTALDTFTLNSAQRAARTLNVDVSSEILELPQPTLELAVAQIVFTASELEEIRDVRLRVDGEPQAWPDGRGELQTDTLTVYDYPDLVPSTQPAFPAIPSPPEA
jgi:spore germination protein GerM